jgi:hypothetical protein
LLALVASAAIGICVGGATYALGSAGTEDGWEELGMLLLGAFLGLGAFAIAYVAGLTLAARRAFATGRRILPFVLSLAVPALLVATAMALAAAADSAGADFPRAMGGLAFAGAVVAAPAAFAWSGTTRGRRIIAAALTALTILMVLTTAGQVALTRHQLNVVADRLPLVLFSGNTAEAPFERWRRDQFGTIAITDDVGSIARQGKRARLKYFAPGGVVFITMHTDIGTCRDTTTYTCRTTGTLQGNEIRRYERITEYGAYPRSDAFDVLVYPDGSAVSVNDDASKDWPPQAGNASTMQVLESLVRVDRGQFERATGSKLRLS